MAATRSRTERVWGRTAIGRAPHTPLPAGSGAQPGDGYVTGANRPRHAGVRGADDQGDAFNRPRSRCWNRAARLAPHVTAMMDVSDGLLLDAWRGWRQPG